MPYGPVGAGPTAPDCTCTFVWIEKTLAAAAASAPMANSQFSAKTLPPRTAGADVPGAERTARL
ncbi:MAG TPA: hypothetical protein VGN37_20890 [Actinocatenispora sp.]